ncbi:MAG: hypothetical protein Q8K51_13780, partial [Nitrospirota bacterium]|nr:hypothetical protein [Nitrospirota bacterium]
NIRGPSKLGFSVQPGNTIYNNTIIPAVEVQIQDSLGNLVPIATNTVTIAIGTNPGVPPGTLIGTLSVSAVAGVATFSNLSIDIAADGYTLTASATGLTGTTSITFNITTGAYGLTQCMADRYGNDFTGGACSAQDVRITSLGLVDASTTSCIGGEIIILDLRAQLSFGMSTKYDIGIFIANDGRTMRYRSTNAPPNNGAASCTVSILPTSSPFFNEDGDACGDVKDGGTPYFDIYGVPVFCQADPTSNGNLYIPFSTSWELSGGNDVCTSAANPVPDNTAKCNIPDVASTTVSVVVLPIITKTDNKTTLSPGEPTTYYVVITNKTGVTLTNALFTDTASPGDSLSYGTITCSTTGGAICPSPLNVAGMTIPSMPNNSSVTFTIQATVKDPSYATFTNTATVTVADPPATPVANRTVSASDTVGGSGSGSGGSRVKVIKWREVFQ